MKIAPSPVETSEQQALKRQVLNRLKRAQGQLKAAIAAVEADSDCRATVTQLAAVSSAVDRAGFVILLGNLKYCLSTTSGSHDLNRLESAGEQVALSPQSALSTVSQTHDEQPAAESLGPPTLEELEKLFMMLR